MPPRSVIDHTGALILMPASSGSARFHAREVSHEAASAPPKLTVELTVKPLKSGEKVGTSEHSKNNAKPLKGLGKGVGQAESGEKE